jgi:hypothetical protein
MKNYSFLLLLLAVVCCAVAACQKNTDTEPTEITLGEKQTAKDYSTSENLFAEAYQIVDMEAQKQPTLNGFTREVSLDVRACPNVTLTPSGSTFPKTLTIDYGTGCTTSSGKTASGKIIAVFSGKTRLLGGTVSMTFQNFVYKGYTLGGTYLVTYTTASNLTAQITNGTLATPDGKNLTYQATFTFMQTEGASTTYLTNGEAGILDDVYAITGSASGKDATNVNYTMTILTPLVKKLNCEWIVSGSVELKVTGQATKKLDFGTGNCDNAATLTVGRLTTPVTLP